VLAGSSSSPRHSGAWVEGLACPVDDPIEARKNAPG
jgi:hypothetical protein